MPKPLRSNDPTPTSVQFRDFGVLNDGTRSKGATITAISVNVLIALALLFLVKAAVVKPKVQHAELMDPIHAAKPEPPPPPKPKLPPPPPPPKLPPVPPPPVPVPPVPVPPPPVPPPPVPPPPVPPPPTPPKPMFQPPPKLAVAPPAPRAVSLMGSAAHLANNDAHPSAVRLGATDNPLKPMSGPAIQRVSMGVAGMPGMPGSNTGSGPRAVGMSMGSGSPTGSNLAGTSPRPVAGMSNGCVGCTGPKTNNVQQVAMASAVQPITVQQPRVQAAVAKSSPTLVYKPEPVYSEEARSMHLEGNVSVRIRVTADGTVQVLEIVHGLGHGLDEAARQAAQGTRFKPAMDASGTPVPWEGVVTVKFQMS